MSNKSKLPDFTVNTIRNIGIIAHIDAGKTTLTERFLYYSGKTHHIGRIEDGDTVMDYLPEERERGITIVAATATFQWVHNNTSHLLHLIDTPGHMDFTAEVERTLRVVDGSVVIFCGTGGVEAQSEKVWHQSDKYKIPKIAFVNKMDRDGASYNSVLNDIRKKFTNIKAIPVTLPIKNDNTLSGIIDLIANNAVFYVGENNSDLEYFPIPEFLHEQAMAAREDMISTLAELSPRIESAYLNDEFISADVLKYEIRKYVLSCKLCPVLAGSAKLNIGLQHVIEAAIDFLPTPIEKDDVHALNYKTGKSEVVNIVDNYFSAIIFKISVSENSELLYIKINSGKLSINDLIKNGRTEEQSKVKRLLRIYSGKVTSINEAFAGDIVGVVGPKKSVTGDTLCSPLKSLLFEKIIFPEPMISIAIEANSKKDHDKLESSLDKIVKEDPTIQFHKNPNTSQLILSGMGELHIEVNIHRLENEFGLAISYGEPRINYKETFLEPMTLTGHFNRQAGPNLLSAEVDFEIQPIALDIDCLEVELKQGINVPDSWKKQSLKTFRDALKNGGSMGFPLHFLQVTILSIRGDKEHTTEGAISGAIIDGINQAIEHGSHLLEPIMILDVYTPDSAYEPLKAYLQSHRTIIIGTDILPNGKHLSCLVPLAETFKLGKELPRVSAGRAAFTMRPHSFQIVPHFLLDGIKIL